MNQNLIVPDRIKEEVLDPRSSQQLFFEIVLRYNHDKNKILFLYKTVKKIEEAILSGEFPFINDYLYNIQVLVLKKCLVLNHARLSEIATRVNTFKFNEGLFQAFLATSQYQDIYQTFLKGHSSFELALKQKYAVSPNTLTHPQLI